MFLPYFDATTAFCWKQINFKNEFFLKRVSSQENDFREYNHIIKISFFLFFYFNIKYYQKKSFYPYYNIKYTKIKIITK